MRTDHSALVWLRKTPEPIGQQARWIEIMESYDFTVEHRPGRLHGNADAMSRIPDECDAETDGLPVGWNEQSDEDYGPQDSVYSESEPQAVREYRTVDVEHGLAVNKVRSCDRTSEENEVDDNDQTRLKTADGGIGVIESVTIDSQVGSDSSFDMKTEQKGDTDISVIVKMMKSSNIKPSWDAVSPWSHVRLYGHNGTD